MSGLDGLDVASACAISSLEYHAHTHTCTPTHHSFLSQVYNYMNHLKQPLGLRPTAGSLRGPAAGRAETAVLVDAVRVRTVSTAKYEYCTRLTSDRTRDRIQLIRSTAAVSVNKYHMLGKTAAVLLFYTLTPLLAGPITFLR